MKPKNYFFFLSRVFLTMSRRAYAEQRKVASKAQDDFKKYEVGKDPLEKEEEITVLQPLGGDEGKTYMKLLRRLLREKTRLGANYVHEARAVQFRIAAYEAEQLHGRVQKEFARDFVMWLHGRGKEKDHAKSWMGRNSLLDDKEVAAYCHMFTVKRTEYLLKLTRLANRRPMGINEHFLFFKYVVRNEPLDAISFHSDSQLLLDETYDAIHKNPASQHPIRDAPHHHEVPPFDTQDRGPRAVARQAERDEDRVSVLDDDDGGDHGPGGGNGRGGGRGRGGDTDEEMQDAPGAEPPPGPPQGQAPRRSARIAARRRANNPGPDGDAEPMDVEPDPEPAVAPVVDAIGRLEKLLERNLNGPDVQLQQAMQAQAESRQQIDELRQKILALENAATSREIAKLPTDEAKAAIAAEKEKAARFEGMLGQSQQQIQQLQDELKQQRSERAKQAQDMKEMLDSYLQNLPRLEGGKEKMEVDDEDTEDGDGNKEMVLHPTVEQSIKFQEQFMKHFVAYMQRAEQREAELIAGLQKNPDYVGPLIEEVEEMKKQSAAITASLENLPAVMAIGWKELADQQQTRESALIVAASNNSEAALAAWKQARDQDYQRTQAQLENFANFMRMMAGREQQSIQQLMKGYEERLDKLTLQIPQQNQTLMLEMRKELTETFNKQLAIASTPVQSELAEAIAMMQHQSNEASQFYAAMSAAAQRAAQAEALLKQSQAQAQQIQAENNQKLLYLKNEAENARRMAQASMQQAYLAQQQNQMNNQRLGWAMQQNQGMREAMDRAAQQQHMMMQNFYQATHGLIKQIGYLQERQPPIPEVNDPLTPNEKWILRIEGGEQPLMLEGPKAAGAGVAYQMPKYSKATTDKIKNESQRDLFMQVHKLEETIIQLANKNNIVLDPELAHNLNVESVHPKVLATKLARYQAALQNWGK